MARHESDREDLMREATGLPRRVSLALPGSAEPVVAGFRRSGALSVYFGPDPVYQFDAAGGLRRAYADGFLYRTQGSTLARLERQRSEAAVTLSRHDLAPPELAAFLQSMADRLRGLRDHLTGADATVIARVPTGDPVERAVLDFLNRLLPREGLPALAPAVPGKR